MSGTPPRTITRSNNTTPKSSGSRQSNSFPQASSNQSSPLGVTRSSDVPVEALSSLRLGNGGQASRLPTRPGLGDRGMKLKLLTNHFRFNVTNVPDFIEYGLKVRRLDTDAEVAGGVRRRVLTLLLGNERFAHSFTDYATKIFSIAKYPLVRPEGSLREIHQITIYNEAQTSPPADTALTHSVELIFRRQLPMQPFLAHAIGVGVRSFDRLDEYLGLFDLMLSHWPDQHADMKTLAGGSKYFLLNDVNSRTDLTGGLVAVAGFCRSVKSSLTMGLLLNINTTSAAFFDDSLRVDVVIARFEQVIDRSATGNLPLAQKIRELSKRLRGMRFRTSYNGVQVRTFCEIANSRTNLTVRPTSDTVTFQNQQGLAVTVHDHFRTTYSTAPRYDPDCLVINCAGSGRRPIFIPSGLAYVQPGQHYSHLLDDVNQATAMIKSACLRPAVNKERTVERGLPRLGIGQSAPDQGPEKLFGIQLEKKMLSVKGRLLNPPRLRFFSPQADSTAKNGRWNLKDKKFCTSVDAAGWKYGILHFHRGASSMPATNIQALRTAITAGIQTYTGVQVAQPVIIPAGRFPDGPTQAVKLALINLLKPLKAQNLGVVFVVLPSKSNLNYSMLKYVADVKVGIQTVCTVIMSDNKVKAGFGEVANLLLKANMKLGGVNHNLHQDSRPSLLTPRSIIIGLDVTHPGQNAMAEAPSVAAIVGTRGRDFFRYSGHLQLQTHRDTDKKAVEELLQLKNMMLRQLKSYKEDNQGALPDRVFVYRDGVGDSQLQLILEREIPRLKEAFTELYTATTMPKLVFLVAQKRHHVRFFREGSNREHDKAFDQNNNVKPGFVHDSEIVSERRWDFYLNSHACIQGTARSCRYIMIYDDLNVSQNGIEELTNRLTWLFGRSTTSISISPAARYADMLCDRARCYMHDVYTGGSHQNYVAVASSWNGEVAPALAKTMFFV